MYHIIHLLVLLPFSGFLLSLLFNGTRERSIAMVAYVIMFVSMSLSVVFSIYWLTIGSPVFSFADGSLSVLLMEVSMRKMDLISSSIFILTELQRLI